MRRMRWMWVAAAAAAALSQSPAAGAAELGENVLRVEASEVACGLRWTWDLAGDNLRNRQAGATITQDFHIVFEPRMSEGPGGLLIQDGHLGGGEIWDRWLVPVDASGWRPISEHGFSSTEYLEGSMPFFSFAGDGTRWLDSSQISAEHRAYVGNPPHAILFAGDFARYGIIPGVESTLHYLDGVGGPVAYSTVVRTLPTTTSLTLVHRAAGDGTDVAYATDVSSNASCANVVLDDADDGDAITDTKRFPVAAGTYSATPSVPAGKRLDAATCTGGADAGTLTGGTLAVAVGADEHVTCTFDIVEPTLLERFDELVASGDLVATPAGTPKTLRNMLVVAQSLAEAGSVAQACEQYEQAYLRIDGAAKPKDFATGPGAVEIAAAIEEEMTTLGCG